MNQCPDQQTCLMYSNGTKRRVHHIRITEKCIYWNGQCTKQGEACNLEKIKRIKMDLKGGA